MNCPSCAHATPDGSLFCEACGAKLELICAPAAPPISRAPDFA
jgi:hypothetical protein